jgi:glycosyltransferase involved in cell wall biosynthesis
MISVVIPLHNKAAYIRRALDSVLAQSWPDFEVIVVDDGSTDGGDRIVESVSDSRLRLYRQQNLGVSAARNKGIELARDPLVTFLDADDKWLPDFLGASLKLQRSWPDLVASFTNYERTDSNRPALTRAMQRGPLASYFEFCLRNGGAGMCSSVPMIKRAAVLKAGGFPVNRRLGEDLDTWFRIACQGPVGYEPTPLARYYTGLGVCSMSNVDCDVWSTFTDWRAKGRIPKHELAAAERYAALLRLIMAASFCRAGTIQEARTLLSGLPKSRVWSLRRLVCVLTAWLPVLPPRIWLALAGRIGVKVQWPTSSENEVPNQFLPHYYGQPENPS